MKVRLFYDRSMIEPLCPDFELALHKSPTGGPPRIVHIHVRERPQWVAVAGEPVPMKKPVQIAVLELLEYWPANNVAIYELRSRPAPGYRWLVYGAGRFLEERTGAQ